MKPKIIIEVLGGCAYVGPATVEIEVHLIDWDNIKGGGEAVVYDLWATTEEYFAGELAKIQEQIDSPINHPKN